MRHGQSEANVAHIWQGRGSSPLTENGRGQAAAAGERLAGRPFAKVISSTLERAANTARIAGFEPEQRDIWLEGDLGAWEGLTFAQVIEGFADELQRLNNGEEIKLGGTGESAREVSDRALEGIAELRTELDDGEEALVVTHGGLINGLIRRILSVPRGGRRLGIPANTAFTRLSFDTVEGEERVLIHSFNDAVHLGPINDWTREHMRQGSPVVEFIRHGQTDGNVQRIMQGQADWGLNETGREQAAALSPTIGTFDAHYASDLGRASETAKILFGGDVVEAPELREVDMGEWNGVAFDDIPRDDYYRKLFEDFEDLPRGRTGERWADVGARMASFVDERSAHHEGERVAMVSHGGSIRTYIGAALGLDHRGVRTFLGFLENTSVSQAVMLPSGPMITAYNVAAHLE